MRIVVAADPWAVELKDAVKAHLIELGHEVMDLGGDAACQVNYYDGAAAAARLIQSGEAERGVLFCGTGMGMAIVANKFKGVYAGVIESPLTARLCRAVNNANVLTMGALLLTPFVALQAVDEWLNTAHTQGLEVHKDFLCGALKAIEQIESQAIGG